MFARLAQSLRARPALDASCTLCARPLSEVAQLVAGIGGAVCDDCLAVGSSAIDAPPKVEGARFGQTLNVLRKLLQALGANAPFQDTMAVVASAIALAGGNAPWLRTFASEAYVCRNAEAALAALAALAPTDETAGDQANRAFYLCRCGRFDDALVAARSVKESSDPLDFAIARINEAAALVGGDQDTPNLLGAEDALAAAEEYLRRCVRVAGGTDPAVYYAPIASSRAEIALHRGDAHRAKRILDSIAPANVDQRLLGDVMDVLAGREMARGIWGAALKTEHPESAISERLRARLARF